MAGKKLKVSVTVDEEYMQRVDAIAAEEERTRSQIVEFAIREFLSKRGAPERRPERREARAKVG
jgi:metal-responsive CopG/Arc/MetJ family transcriptional regulator